MSDTDRLRSERDGLQRKVTELQREAAARMRTIERLEMELVRRVVSVVASCRYCSDLVRVVPFCSNCGPHPWYGPCDGLGDDGGCSECRRFGAWLESAPFGGRDGDNGRRNQPDDKRGSSPSREMPEADTSR